MREDEKDEALRAIAMHYGMPVFLALVKEIADRIKEGVLSTPLDSDPTKAQAQLYAARMKAEGAVAVMNALGTKVRELKGRER